MKLIASTKNQWFQILLDVSIFLIEFLTVMNAYNGTKLDYLLIFCIPNFLTIVHLLLYGKKIFMYSLPSLFVHSWGVIAQGAWYSEYWQIHTRHRTEYYDTHAVFTAVLFYIIFRSVELYFVKKNNT